MTPRECCGDIRDQRLRLAIMFDRKGDIAKLEHRRSLANAVITFNAKKRSRDFCAAYQEEVRDVWSC